MAQKIYERLELLEFLSVGKDQHSPPVSNTFSAESDKSCLLEQFDDYLTSGWRIVKHMEINIAICALVMLSDISLIVKAMYYTPHNCCFNTWLTILY